MVSDWKNLETGNLETQNAQVAQTAGGIPFRTGAVWVRIPPGVQEDVGGHFWPKPQKICNSGCVRPTLNGGYGVTAALQSSKLKVPVRVRLSAQIEKEDRQISVCCAALLTQFPTKVGMGVRVPCPPRSMAKPQFRFDKLKWKIKQSHRSGDRS